MTFAFSMASTMNGPFNRGRLIRIAGYVAILAVGVFMVAMLTLRHQSDMRAAVQHFREIQLSETKSEVDKIESAFNHLHQNLRTISFIPGIRNIGRHAEGVTDNTIAVVSQLYLNLSADLDVSEVYIVPVDMDPEHVDILTHRTEEPIMSFDGLIGRNSGDRNAPKITPHIPGNEIGGPDDPNQGDETEEYHLLKEQMSWLRRNAAQLEQGFEINVPLISGHEVITCDNTDYKTSHSDADRRGFIFSVPFYGADGGLKGTVSAIIRTNALRKLLPSDSMLVNKSYGVAVLGPRAALSYTSFEYAERLEPDPSLIYSTIQEVGTDDVRGHWVLWDGETNKTFETSADARSADSSYWGGLTIAFLLTAFASIVWMLIQGTIHHKEINERNLIQKVAERTRDFESLMETTLRAEAEAESAKRQALREANALLEEFIEHAPAAIAMFDCHLNYIAHTRRWAVQHVLEDANFVGLHQYDVLPQMGQAWDEIYKSGLSGRIERHDCDPFLKADGSVQWLTWEVRPWRRPDGTVGGLIMMTEDITARKEIEQQLQKALQTAESAARAKADFLANMSHELRTPLSGIIGSADILLAEDTAVLAPEHRKLIELQRTCGADLLSIVNDILDFSKADAGNLKLEEIAVPVADLISGCIATITPNASRKKLVIETKLADDVAPAILGDPTRLRQILLNLLSNAVKFTPDRGKVGLSVSMIGEDRMRFAVSDTGIGISADQITSLFTRFSQADTSTTRNFGGTGLGLAISRQFVELMHGTIDVTSRPGFGSTFFFDIPVRVAEAPTSAKPIEMTGAGTSAHHVLVAEDNATNRMLISKMLTKFGCAVTLVANGVEAVAALTKPGGHDFDIVLMDIQMPEMDGQEATRRIRQHEVRMSGSRHVPIVALTANGFPEEVAEYLSAGMDTHLLKPIDWQRLFATITTLASDHGDDAKEAASDAAFARAEAEASNQAQNLSASAEPADPHLSTIDQATLDDLRDSLGQETANEIVCLFAGELDDRVQRMSAAAQAADLAKEAHALASAARSVGCIDLANQCKDMEHAVRAGETDVGPRLAGILLAATRAGQAISKLTQVA